PHRDGVDEDQRDLVGDGPAVRVVHQRVAGPRRRRHRLEATEARTRAGVHAGQLVLALHVVPADLGQALGHVLGDVGRRRDRIAGEDAAARGDGALGQRVRTGLQQAAALDLAPGPLLPRRDQGLLHGVLDGRHQWWPPVLLGCLFSVISPLASQRSWPSRHFTARLAHRSHLAPRATPALLGCLFSVISPLASQRSWLPRLLPPPLAHPPPPPPRPPPALLRSPFPLLRP